MVFNIIMISLIIQSIANLIFRRKIEVLNCGIWGFYGTVAARKREFNWLKFDWMGAVNDERGGDACGRMVGTTLEHSNEFKKKKYNEFSRAYYPPKIPVNTKIILGHTRKMSLNYNKTGGIEYSQPILFFNEDGTNKVVGVHNGTIYNYKKMLESYKIPLNSLKYFNDTTKRFEMHEMNDSQSLVNLIGVHKKYEELINYQGGAAFAIYDYELDELILWSGSSKLTQYVKYDVRERPLHILKGPDFVWFSSLEDALLNINYDPDLEVEEVPENTLQRYKDGVLIESIEYDRSDSTQYEVFVFPKRNDDKFNLRFCPVCSGSGFSRYSECRRCDGSGFIEKVHFQPQLPLYVDNANELSSEILSKPPDIMEFKRLRYYINGNLAHGVYHLNMFGRNSKYKISAEDTNMDMQITKPYYFVFGCMMDDHSAWTKWSRKMKRIADLNASTAYKMAQDTKYPIYFQHLQKCYGAYVKDGFSGVVNALFSTKKYYFVNGNFARSELSMSPNNADHGKAMSDESFSRKIFDGTAKKNDNEDDQDKIIALPNSNFENDLPFDVDESANNNLSKEENGMYNDLVKRAMRNQIADILISLNDAKEDLFKFSDDEKVMEMNIMIEEWEDKLKRIETQYENGSDL